MMSGLAKGSICCGYGVSGVATLGYDCVVIPGALKSTDMEMMAGSQICGRSKGLATMPTATMAKTVCSKELEEYIRGLRVRFPKGEKYNLRTSSVVNIVQRSDFMILL